MVTYIIRRLLLVPLLLFGVSILIFGMLQFLDPVERASLYVRGDFKSEAQVDAVINRYCLNCPIYRQYLNWVVGTINPVSGEREGGILFGNFGGRGGPRKSRMSLEEREGFRRRMRDRCGSPPAATMADHAEKPVQ